VLIISLTAASWAVFIRNCESKGPKNQVTLFVSGDRQTFRELVYLLVRLSVHINILME
jgi:hypothetical protein